MKNLKKRKTQAIKGCKWARQLRDSLKKARQRAPLFLLLIFKNFALFRVDALPMATHPRRAQPFFCYFFSKLALRRIKVIVAIFVSLSLKLKIDYNQKARQKPRFFLLHINFTAIVVYRAYVVFVAIGFAARLVL